MLPLDYFLYMAEAEGADNLVDTRPAKINAAIKEFISKANAGININNSIAQILKNHGLTEDMLTPREKNYIMSEVNKHII